MKVLFINPSVGYYTRALSNPLGLLSIATYVKQHGHEVKLEDRCVNKSNINRLLDSYKPDIIGVSLMSSRGLIDAEKVFKPNAANKPVYDKMFGAYKELYAANKKIFKMLNG